MPLQLQASPRELCIGLLVALGVLTIVKDLLEYADRVRLAGQLDEDPGGPAREAQEYLRREEQDDEDPSAG